MDIKRNSIALRAVNKLEQYFDQVIKQNNEFQRIICQLNFYSSLLLEKIQDERNKIALIKPCVYFLQIKNCQLSFVSKQVVQRKTDGNNTF